jgi:chemotaxis protein methyltransferase CheR
MAMSLVELDFIRTMLQQRAGIVLDREKGYLVEMRLGALARREGFATLNGLIAEVRRGESELTSRVVEAMTTNETSFFRDVHPFDALRKVILPDLIRRRATERSLRIWCAACSSGQEPYSIAMLLRDHFPSLATWNMRLVATDLSVDMIERARQGRYSALEVHRGLTPELLARHFMRQGEEWHVRDEIKRVVEFRTLNLLGPWPGLGSLDLVLLRNVLIYLDQASKQSVLARLRNMLRPDGCLMLGSAETTLHIDEAFEVVQQERTTCYRLATAPRRP